MKPEELARLQALTPSRPGWATWVHLAQYLQEHPDGVDLAAERIRDWPSWAAYDFRERLEDPEGFPESLIRSHSADFTDRGVDEEWPRGGQLRGLRLSYRSAEELQRSRMLREADLSGLEFLQLSMGRPVLPPWPPTEATATADGRGPLDLVLQNPSISRIRELDARRAGLSTSELALLAGPVFRDSLAVLVLSGNPVGGTGALELATSPVMERLERLDLQDCGLGAEAVAALAAAPAPRLRHLDLSFNALGDRAAVALAAAPGLLALRILNLRANSFGRSGVEALSGSPFRVLGLPGEDAPAPPASAALPPGLRCLLVAAFPFPQPRIRGDSVEPDENLLGALHEHGRALSGPERRALLQELLRILGEVSSLIPLCLHGSGRRLGRAWKILEPLESAVVPEALASAHPGAALLLQWCFARGVSDEALDLAAASATSEPLSRALRAVMALGHVPKRRGVPHLLRALEDPRPLLRLTACAALNRALGPPEPSGLDPAALPGPDAEPAAWREAL